MTVTAVEYTSATGLPKKTRSICPECGKVLDAIILERDGKVWMDKECSEHGKFSDIYWSDVDMYLRAEKFAHDGIGLHNSMNENLKEGDDDTVSIMIGGDKVNMLTGTVLANVDLTNRCNMQCPICFAEANSAGYVCEPDFDTVHKMLLTLRNEEPIKCTAVQFAGGEPTVHHDFIKIVKDAKDLDFAQIQVATNGIKFARDYEFLKESKLAGLNTIYLSFDGVSDDIYIQARARKMFQVKLDVIANCRRLVEEGLKSPSIVLVPTVVMGMNDHQIGDIIKFALDNSDIIRGINFQPVAFTGRITQEEREKGRFTLSDLVNRVQEQTGFATPDDWYPVPVVAPISKFASVILGHNKVTFTTHPHCGIATYLFCDDKGNVVPFPRFVNVEMFSNELDRIADKADKSIFKKFYALKIIKLLNKCVDESKMPEGLTKRKFIDMIAGVMSNSSKERLAAFSWKMLLISGMHFQDSYNYDIERVRRCGVHYITPDCQVIPFCAYNSGPEYRIETEKKFSVPLEEFKAKNARAAKELEEALVVPDDMKVDAPQQ